MDPIRQSKGSLQAPTNQPGSSDQSKLPQGVKEPIQTQLLPMHYTQPLQTSVTSLDIQQPPRQMSPPLSSAWNQAASWLSGPRLGISSDSSYPLQNSFHEMQQLSEQFKHMTTEPLRRAGSVRTYGRKIMCSKYRYGNRLETISEVEQNITNESTNSILGKTQGPSNIESVRDMRSADVRNRYRKLLPNSFLRNIRKNDSLKRCSWIEGFGCSQVQTNQPGSSGSFECSQGFIEPIATTQLQPIHFKQLPPTPTKNIDNTQRPPTYLSPSLSGAWQPTVPLLRGPRIIISDARQPTVPLLRGPRLEISDDDSLRRQNLLHEMQHITETPNDMTIDDDMI